MYIEKDGYKHIYYTFPDISYCNLKYSTKMHILPLSEANKRSEIWELFCKNLEMPQEVKEYIEKMTTDKYLQLL